jgi:hypothetical protein
MDAREEPPRAARLVVVAAPGAPKYVGTTFDLSPDKGADGRGYCIGRAAAAECSFAIDGISRCLTFVRIVDGRWSAVDTGETNGVFVNGEQIRKTRSLKEGDRIGMGPEGKALEIAFSEG